MCPSRAGVPGESARFFRDERCASNEARPMAIGAVRMEKPIVLR
jgi:hypothetical protein